MIIAGDYNTITTCTSDIKVEVDGTENPNSMIMNTLNYVDSVSPNELCVDRQSQDCNVTNKLSTWLLALCKSTDIYLLNSRIGNGKCGAFTRVSSTIGNSVVDYILVDDNVADFVANFSICKSLSESDHCPLT